MRRWSSSEAGPSTHIEGGVSDHEGSSRRLKIRHPCSPAPRVRATQLIDRPGTDWHDWPHSAARRDLLIPKAVIDETALFSFHFRNSGTRTTHLL
ncbi:hypothetical protein VTI28DRAFT_3131 [Corynascus sepedonium]